jgi:transcription termination factor NusB
VAINESIELAKNYGGPNAARFVNGVLGTIYRDMAEKRHVATGEKAEKEPAKK